MKCQPNKLQRNDFSSGCQNVADVLLEVLDYVVVHELCHRKEWNHSDRCWNEVAKILPDYKTRRKCPKDNGSNLIARI